MFLAPFTRYLSQYKMTSWDIGFMFMVWAITVIAMGTEVTDNQTYSVPILSLISPGYYLAGALFLTAFFAGIKLLGTYLADTGKSDSPRQFTSRIGEVFIATFVVCALGAVSGSTILLLTNYLAR